MSLIFDIETVGEEFSNLDETTKQSLTRWIRREAGEDQGKYNFMQKDLEEGLGFSPLTGEIVAIGVFDTEKNKGVVYYQSPDQKEEEYREENFIFKAMTEEQMLKNFWQGVMNYREFVSFNGRSFDVPFLQLRSAIHDIKPSKDLLSNRYLSNQHYAAKHIDLLDQLTFYGAARRRGSLHLYCRAFGINSPKALGITGDDVGRLFHEKKYKDIAEYNSWDLIAIWELYKRWQTNLNFSKNN
jgi:uncharacterized protein YprB with RNaseH-like and TPR domain